MPLWPFVVVHWQQTFQIISLISGKLGSSLKDPHCSDVCIWRPYDRRGRAGCLCWCIIWDRRCHTRALTGLLIVPVENKDKGKVWLRRVPRPWVQLGSLPAEAGVPVYHLTRGPHSRLHELEMSCEHGQTRCEDENMEADRNKRGLGERREAEREREMQRATGVPKCWRDCAGMVARGLSAEWAPLPLLPPSEERQRWCSDAGKCVWHTHTHSQTPLWPRRLRSPAAVFIRAVCVCARHCLRVFVLFKTQTGIYVFSGALACVYFHCLLFYLRSVLRPQHHLTDEISYSRRRVNCARYMADIIQMCVCVCVCIDQARDRL